MAAEKDYVLGTHDDELTRLGLQHRVWRPRASAAWKRAGFTAGQTLIDVGCGPGWATLDLADIAGPQGRVIALERSRRFLDALAANAAARGIGNIEPHELDLDEQPLPGVQADGAWARWVFAFVREPRQLLERVAGSLRPGGKLVIHEYYDYRAWRLAPADEAFEEFVTEVMASWRANGGEPDIGNDLARWLPELGFDVIEANPIVEMARPGDFLWQWPRAFVNIGLDRLVELGRVSEARAAQMRGAFDRTERTPNAFLFTPGVLELVARKR